MEKLKSVLYARVSTDKEEQLQSYLQQQKFKDDRFNIVTVFDDRSSGTSIKKRTGFIEMLKYCGVDISFSKDDYIFNIFKPTDIECIIVSNTSRYGRNLIDVKRSLDVLHKQGIKVFFKDLNAFSDNDQLEILLNIYFTLDAQYSKDLSRKSKDGIRRLRKNENHVFCTGGIKGYNLKAGKLTKNEDAEKIYNIYYDYIYNDYSFNKLAEKYGFKPTTIGSILNNSKYYGYDKYLNKINPNIEPIITKEMYDKVQELKKIRTNGKRGKNANTYGLSSKIICPCCGSFYHCRKTTKKKIWSCQSSIIRNGKNCNSGGISENRINQYLKDILLSGSCDGEIALKIDRLLDDLRLIDISVIQNNLKDIESMLNRLIDLYLMGDINKDILDNKKVALNKEKEELEQKLLYANNQNKRIEEIENLYNTYTEKLNYLKDLARNNNFDELHKNIKNIYLYNKGIGVYERTQVRKVVFKDMDILE